MTCVSNPSTGKAGTGGPMGPEEHHLRLSSGLHMEGVRGEDPTCVVGSPLVHP